MPHDLTTTAGSDAESFYDRFAHLYDLTFKVNRYRNSVENYLRESSLQLPAGAHVLDAGCGTGLLTLALLNVLTRPAFVTAVDLSASSLRTARRAVLAAGAPRKHQFSFAQANILSLPFQDDAFDFIVTSGALEYTPLRAGFDELARVVRPGGYLFHLPVRPSPVSRVLEVMFRFKTHPPAKVISETERHFRIVDHHRFPTSEPIGWTKTAMLSQKQ